MTRRLTSQDHRAARVAGRPSFGRGTTSALMALCLISAVRAL